MFARYTSLAAVLLLLLATGCGRTHYRVHADGDAHAILREKSGHSPWMPPSDYSLYPNPMSRLYDPTPLDDPILKTPSPKLYAYDLPPLPERDPGRLRPDLRDERRPGPEIRRLPSVQLTTYQVPRNELPSSEERPDLPTDTGPPEDALSTPEASEETSPSEPSDEVENADAVLGVRQAKIPQSYWDTIPDECLRRMIEFESVREEYRRTFDNDPPSDLFDTSPKLTLEDIVDLTLLNSREYQTQKEILYRAALALSLERFGYQLKPSVGGNNTAADFTHDRVGGITENTLRIPSNLTVDKLLITGGDFLASFANSVILTFNGPNGFSMDVASDLFFEFFQSILQRDTLLEDLTQAERDVIYAARDFARFRKELFVSQARQYYGLIREYRQIEINSQNYFTLVREFDQRAAEFRGGFTPRIELDQIEQQVLNGRRGLITVCTTLEGSLDTLKLRIGLPTEQPINVDLTELNLLTQRDELAVSGELIERVRRRLSDERASEEPARATLLSQSVVLLDRMLESIRQREELNYQPPDPKRLRVLRGRLRIAAARLNVEQSEADLNTELQLESPDMLTVFQRRIDVIAQISRLIDAQLELAEELGQPEDHVRMLRQRRNQYNQRANSQVDRVEELIAQGQLNRLPRLVAELEQLQGSAEMTVRSIDTLVSENTSQGSPEQQLEQTISLVDVLLAESGTFLEDAEGGLVPVEIDMDDAMLTALVLRFDLINERGFLADDWRQIKIAADDLKSILNLRATHTIRTRPDVNRPFGFTFEESTTRVIGTFDAPFNRRAQRNGYRQTLINYQGALRRLTELEDTIKLSVRDDLRSLTLDREQYVIDVASAALAFERVVSTELELSLGVGNVIARDFLEGAIRVHQRG